MKLTKLKNLALIALCTVFGYVAVGADVQFNEIVSSNDADSAPSGKKVVDENNRDCDWIELRNTTAGAINLKDWGLSDKKDLFKCKLPDVTINANSYLILYCTGSNYVKTVSGKTYCHVDLSISSEGETLTLTKKGASSAMDTATFGYIPCNCSYGRKSNGTNWGYFSSSNVTPGASNGSSAYASLLKPVKFSPERKVISGSGNTTITLSSPDGADIYYTTDCSEPTTSSTKYTGPITISGTTIIRAMPYKSGELSYRNIQTHSYIYLNQVATYNWTSGDNKYPTIWNAGSYGTTTDSGQTARYKPSSSILNSDSKIADFIACLTNAPIVSITVNREEMFGSDKGIYPHPYSIDTNRVCSLEWVTGSDTNLIFGVDAYVNIAGAGSRFFKYTLKKSLRVKFSKELGSAHLDKPIFKDNGYDDTGFKSIQFRAEHNQSFSHTDPNKLPGTYLKDEYFRDVQGKLSGLTAPGTWVHLFIDGLYWGVYNPTERVDAGLGSRQNWGDKDDYVSLKADCLSSTLKGAPSIRDDDGADGAKNLKAYMQELCKKNYGSYSPASVKDLTVKSEYERAMRWFDVSHFADYMNITYWSGNYDWPWNNWVMTGSKKLGVPFRFYSWDAESAWYKVDDSTCGQSRVNEFASNKRPWDYYDGAQTYGPQQVQWALKTSPEYRLLFSDRVHEAFREGGVLSKANRDADMRAYAKRVGKLLFAEEARWGKAGDYNNWKTQMGHLTNKWYTSTKSGLDLRTEAHLGSLTRAGLYPNFNTPEFNVNSSGNSATMTLPSDSSISVYYTTDGSDPRVPFTGTAYSDGSSHGIFGDVATSATKYTSNKTITLSADGILKARARKSSGEWGYLTTASLKATTQSGVKLWGFAGVPPSGDDGIGEFIIITNTSSSTSKELKGYVIKIWKEADKETDAKCVYTFEDNQTLAAKGYLRLDNNPKKWNKITNNKVCFAIYDASGAKVDSGTVYQEDIGVDANGMYAVRDFTKDEWKAAPISSAPGAQEIEPSPASAFTLSGNKSASIVDLYTKTNATLTLSNLTGSNFAVRVHSLASSQLTLTMKYSGGVTNRIDIDKNSDNVPFLDAPDFNLVITGNGGAKITNTKKLENSGIIRAKDLTVESGYTSVEFDNNKDDTACVYLTGNFWQKDGDFRVKMVKGYTNEFYGVRLASDNAWAKIDGGKFKATVGGLKSAGIKVKKTGNVYFKGGEIDCDVKGGCVRFVDGGTLSISGGETSVNFDGDLTETNEVGQVTTDALEKLASCTNARVFKVDYNINITGGKVKVDLDALQYNTLGARAFSADGVEGVGGNLTISGSDTIVNLKTGDDCVDVAGNISISGGKVYAKSYFGHGLDATGSVTISDGLVLAYSFGDNAIAIDGGSVVINGGKVVALGGAGTTSAVTSPSGSAPLYRASNLATANYKDKYMTLQGANNGNNTPKTTVQIPTLTGANFSILATVPGMTSGAKPTWSASVPTEGGIDFHNVYEYTGPYVEPGASITKPTIPATVSYDGTDKKPSLSVTGVSFTYNPTGAWIEPNTYTVICSLTDKTKDTWDDGTTADITLTMQIVEGDPDLPTGYKRLEYVESGSGQYVDTGYKAQNGLSADIVLEMKSVSTANNNIILGAYASSAEAYVVNANKSGKWSASLGNETRAEGGSIATGTKYTINSTITSGNTITLKVNGSQVVSKSYSNPGTSTYNLYLLARNYNNAGDNVAAAKLYSAVLKVNGSEVRNYIPCMNNDDKVGLYDKVSGNFYESANGTAFVAGPVVTPTGPTKVTVPTATTSFVYDGTAKTSVASGTGYTVTDGMKTDVGSYTAVAKLVNTTDYVWSDSTTADKSFSWQITVAANDWTVSPSISKTEWTQGDAAGTLTVAKAKFGTVAATIAKDGGAASAFSGMLPTAVGSYVITYTLATSSNWTNPATTAKTVAFTIKQGTTPPTPVGRLPEGYTELEYIASTDGGNQYFNTGIKGQRSMTVTAKVMPTKITSYATIIGSCDNNNAGNRFYPVYFSSSVWKPTLGQAYSSTKSVELNKAVSIVAVSSADGTTGTFTLDGVPVSLTTGTAYPVGANGNGYDMYVFARNYGNSKDNLLPFVGAIYSLNIEVGGSKLAEYVPCKNPQGVVGMYDMVSGSFKNSLNGSFVAGPEVPSPTPVEPTTVTVPTATTSFVYDGTAKTSVAAGTGYTVTDGTKTDVGTYTAVAKLDNTTDYVWSDKTTADKSFSWQITAAANDWTMSPSITKTEWTQGDAAGTLTAAQAKFGTVAATIAKDGATATAFSGTLPTAVGSYVITYTLATSSNWTNPSLATKTVSFTIKQGTTPPTPVGRLPEGYTELDSVTATGTQYIDTGVNAQNGLVTELDMTVNGITSSALVLGAYASNAEAYYGYMNGNNWAFGIGQSSERDKPTTTVSQIAVGTRTKMVFTQSASATAGKVTRLSVTANGTKISERDYASPATTANMYLFARNDIATPQIDKYVKVTLYSIKFTLNGTPLRNLVPCTNPDKVVGLYDLVSGNFFAPKGGTLVAGDPVDPVIPTPTKPTIDGKDVEPSAIFESATSQSAILYPSAPTVTGTAGNQTITYGGVTVSVPSWYTAAANGNALTLSFTGKGAEPVLAQEGNTPAFALLDNGTVSLHISNEKPLLWYSVGTKSKLSDDWTFGPYAQGASDFTAQKSGTTRFYTIRVLDYNPSK